MRILVADDDPVVRMIVTRHLAAAGHDVDALEDGDAVLATVREERPDALVMDVMMPTRTGWDVLADLRADAAFERLPVVLLSGRDVAADVRHGYERGASLVLSKSDDLSRLPGLIETLRNAQQVPPQDPQH